MKRLSCMRVLLVAIVVTLFIPLVLYSSLGHSSIERKAVSEEVQHSKPKNTGRKLDSVYTGISKSQNKPKIPVSITKPTKNVSTEPTSDTPGDSTEPTSNPTSSDTPGDPTRTDMGLSRWFLESLNSKEIVYNSEKYQALAPDDMVFIIQVHKRIHYLRYLLESFEAAQGIEKVLLIFSHDYYDEEINNLIRSIKYTKVMQLFFPHSLQVHPDMFPGESPGDCGRDFTKQKAEEVKCNYWQHPDHYGHYRTATVTAIKHHWWWKINKVFDDLNITANFNGTVFFLEEDHYISPDAVLVARDLIRLRDSECPQCDFINLGMYIGTSAFSSHSSLAYETLWYSAKHNMGFGMDRKTWNKVKKCASDFCKFDDYNWDWSLCSLSKGCVSPPLRVLISPSPRIFHAGTCGTHQKKTCDWDKDIRRIRSTLRSNKQFLFPSKMEMTPDKSQTQRYLSRIKVLKGYGGWSDPRDIELCTSFVKS